MQKTESTRIKEGKEKEIEKEKTVKIYLHRKMLSKIKKKSYAKYSGKKRINITVSFAISGQFFLSEK